MTKKAIRPSEPGVARSFSLAEIDARERRKAQTRNRIIDAARLAFLGEGYAISLEEIAHRAGVSRSSVFNQFENKRQLFRVVMDLVCQQLFDEMGKVARDLPLRDAMIAYGRIYVREAMHPEAIAVARLGVSAEGRQEGVGKLTYEAWRKASVVIVAAFLSRQMAKGLIVRADPTRMAERFFAACIGQTRNRLFFDLPGDSPEQIETQVVETVELFVRGLEMRD